MLPSTDPVSAETRFIPNAPQAQLQNAFAKFSETALSLERSYALLRDEVARLREELTRKQGELESERERLRQAKALGEYSALLAHEVRNPLASMELFTELLLECGDLQEDAHGWVEQLQAGLRTLTTLTNNVLQLHDDGSHPHLTKVQIGNLLKATVEFLAPVSVQNGVRIVLRDESDGAALAGDATRLQQVILNLALNAFYASRQGGLVSVTAKRVSGAERVCISVEDNGRGIQPEHLGRIFEAGFTTKPGSVGLGLAVSRKIVEQHGGSIRVESEPGKQTILILELPVL
ncbi:MAG: sensor histidine kinase [Acidobacteriaceae bacterium]